MCGRSNNTPGFCLALSEAYSWLCEAPYMKCLAKIVNSWIQSTIFAESSILDVSLGSEYISDYLEAFSIITDWHFQFESFMNVFNLISILLKYLEQTFSR